MIHIASGRVSWFRLAHSFTTSQLTGRGRSPLHSKHHEKPHMQWTSLDCMLHSVQESPHRTHEWSKGVCARRTWEQDTSNQGMPSHHALQSECTAPSNLHNMRHDHKASRPSREDL